MKYLIDFFIFKVKRIEVDWFSVALSIGKASPTDQSVQHGRTESSAGPGSWAPESGWYRENHPVVERGKGTLCESTKRVNKTLSCCWKR